jgi:hypothetical protein
MVDVVLRVEEAGRMQVLENRDIRALIEAPRPVSG